MERNGNWNETLECGIIGVGSKACNGVKIATNYIHIVLKIVLSPQA